MDRPASRRPPAPTRKITVGGLFGAAKNLRECENDPDLVEFEIDYTTGPKVPKSHSGVSGGALWELHIEVDKHLNRVKVNKRLYGVAYRESDDGRRITSNAARLIDTLTQQIAAKWPEDS
jgi:hypothetical protein